jgi:hypothetical protein
VSSEDDADLPDDSADKDLTATGAASPKTAILKETGAEKRRERVSIANIAAPGVL